MRFSNPLDTATAGPSTVQLRTPIGTDVPVVVQSEAERIETVPTASALPAGTTFRLRVGTGLRDVHGQFLGSAVEQGFKTAEGRWSPFATALAPLGLFTGGTGPVLAVSGSGPLVAAWTDRANNRDTLFFAARPSLNWLPPVSVRESAEFGALYGVRIHVGPNNSALLTWLESAAGSTSLMFSALPSGSTTWSTPVAVNAISGSATLLSYVSITDGAGNLTLLSLTSDKVYAVRRSSVGVWSAPQHITAPTASFLFNLRVAGEPSGNITAAWVQDDSAGRGIYAAQYSRGAGAWGAAQRLGQASSSSNNLVSVAMDANGGAVVVHANSGNFGAAATVELSGKPPGAATWSPFERVDLAANGAGHPALVFDDANTLTVAWVQGDGIYARRRAAAGTWSQPERVLTVLSVAADSLRLATDVGGNVFLAMLESQTIRALRYSSSSGQWELATDIGTPAQGEPVFANTPELGVDNSGTVTVMWFALSMFGGNLEPNVSANLFR